MPSLAILVASFLSTFTLAAAMPGPGPAIRNTNLCSGQTLSGDIPFTNDVTFTLLSVSKVDTNVHTRLALRTPAGKGPGEAWLVTANSIDIYQDAEKFFMHDGGISALNANGDVVAVSSLVEEVNSLLTFARPPLGVKVAPVETYCEKVDTSGAESTYIYTLGANNDAEHFSLCKGSPSDEGSIVVFNAVEAGSAAAGIDYDTCTPVDLQLVLRVIR